MALWDDDDIEMGNTEIGDSTRGMQSDDYVGAASQALTKLRGNLARLAAGRFGSHAPVTKRLRSQYKDSGQLGIVINSTITLAAPTPATWQNVALSGASTVYSSFKPARVVVNEILAVTLTNSASGTTTVVADVTNASDLLLVGGFSGSINVFPNAPSAATGINCAALQANAFGVGISWPTVNPGIPVTVNLLLMSSALFRAIPTGYVVTDITQIAVTVYFSLFGGQLRG